jgi:hypothetical protein
VADRGRSNPVEPPSTPKSAASAPPDSCLHGRRRPASARCPRYYPHSARLTPPVPQLLPRFRALARLGRRQTERLVRSVLEASENAAQNRPFHDGRLIGSHPERPFEVSSMNRWYAVECGRRRDGEIAPTAVTHPERPKVGLRFRGSSMHFTPTRPRQDAFGSVRPGAHVRDCFKQARPRRQSAPRHAHLSRSGHAGGAIR